MANHLSKMLVSFYDLFIMVPLSIERMVRYHRETAAAPKAEPVLEHEPNTAGEA